MNEIDENKIAVLPNHSLAALAREKLETLVFNGQILSGEKAKESVIAAEIGLSRGPVREACQAMVSEGFFTTVNQRGFFVREFTDQEITQLYQIRGHLGLLAGTLAVQNVTPTDLTKIKEIHDRMQGAAVDGAWPVFFNLTQSFNSTFLSLTKNDELMKIYVRLTKSVRIYRVKYLKYFDDKKDQRSWLVDSFEASIEARHKIIDALELGDGEMTGIFLRRHAIDSQSRTEKLVSRYQDENSKVGPKI